MQKKIIGLLIVSLFFTYNLHSQQRETISLSEPQKSGGMPLFEALNNRSSGRTFSPQPIKEKDLSNLLWAAFGVNRDDGRRTAPSARNWRQTDIYLIREDGWYLYEPEGHSLIKMGNDDLREFAGTQDFVGTAPINLIYVSDHARMTGGDEQSRIFHSATDVGFISQNVYLFAASEGLSTVVRGLVDREKLHQVLKLRPTQHVILGQTVGYPGE
jgi:SagB-type dehydrogenase family enzyme